MYIPAKNSYTYCLLPYIFRALWEAVSWVPNKIEGLQVKSKLTVLKWCQMFLHWHLFIGVFVPLIKQKIISSSEKAPSSQGLPTEGWRPNKAKGLRKWPGNIKKRPHFTLLLSKTWIKHDRRVWSSKPSLGQTLIIPLKRHRPTAWHGTWVHSHLAPTYILSPARANQTVRHSGVPMHHFPKTDSAQELPGLQDLCPTAQGPTGHTAGHVCPHPACWAVTPALAKFSRRQALDQNQSWWELAEKANFMMGSRNTKQIVGQNTEWTTASNSHICHKADSVALQLGEWWAGRWVQAVLLQNQGGSTHTTQLKVPIVLQLHWAQEAGCQGCMTSVSHLCLTQCLIQGRGSDQRMWLRMNVLLHLWDGIWS